MKGRASTGSPFLGRCAILPGVLNDGRLDTALGSLPFTGASMPDGCTVGVVIRPERVSISETGPFEGKIERITCLGDRFEAELTGPGWRVWAMMPQAAKLGESLRFAISNTIIVSA